MESFVNTQIRNIYLIHNLNVIFLKQQSSFKKLANKFI